MNLQALLVAFASGRLMKENRPMQMTSVKNGDEGWMWCCGWDPRWYRLQARVK